MELLNFNGVRFAVGLRWYTFTGDTPLMKEARDRSAAISTSSAGKTQYNAVLVRGDQRQVGFAEAEGQVPQVASLAAVLADARPGKWVARLKLAGNRMLVIACVQGRVVPEGDFIGAEDKAMELTEELKRNYGSDLDVIEEDNPEAAYSKLTSWVSLVKIKPTKLRPLSDVTHYMKVGLPVAAIVLLVLIGYGVISHYVNANKQAADEAASEQSREQVRQQQEKRQEELAAKVAAPVTTDMTPGAMLAACGYAYHHLPLFSKGWALKTWSCDGRNEVQTWGFANGASMTELPAGAEIDAKSPQQVIAIRSIPTSNSGGNQTLATDVTSGTKSFFGFAQNAAASGISLVWDPISTTQPQPGQPLPPEAGKWSMTLLALSPFDVEPGLLQVQGISVNKMTLTLNHSSGSWLLEGKMYAKD